MFFAHSENDRRTKHKLIDHLVWTAELERSLPQTIILSTCLMAHAGQE